MICNMNAPTLRDRRRIILAAVWLEDVQFMGIAKYAWEAHWNLTRIEPDQEDRLRLRAVDGVICQLYPSRKKFVNAVKGLHCPKVELSNYVPAMRLPRVMPDFYEVGRQAAQHFLERGFTHFLFIGKHIQVQREHTYYQGYSGMLSTAGFSPRIIWVEDQPVTTPDRLSSHTILDENSTRARQELLSELTKLPKPLAVFTQLDCHAIDLVDACHEAGIRIPEQVAIVTVSESPLLCELTDIPFSSISNNMFQQGYRAAALLDRMINGEQIDDTITYIPPDPIVVRASSNIMAIENEQIAGAVAFILQNLATKGLSVSDVARAAGMPRWKLYKDFENLTGQTVAAFIDYERLRKGQELLASSDMKIGHISDACGYTDLKHFRRSMKRSVRMGPRAYREMHNKG